MKNSLTLELKVIERFIHKNKQKRYKQFVSVEKTRSKFLNDLPHFKYFKNERFMKVERHEMALILERLKEVKRASSTCYAISENPNLDKKILDIAFALDATIGYGMGTILVFGDADIVYYEGENASERLISI